MIRSVPCSTSRPDPAAARRRAAPESVPQPVPGWVIDLSAVRRRRVDAGRLRAAMPGDWAAWIEAEFGGDDAAAAIAFGVEASTPRKWRTGLHAPSGWALAIALRDFPSAARLLDCGRVAA